jgi:hypothetical protein
VSSFAAQEAKPPQSPAQVEASYTLAIEKRAADILAVLDLKDGAKSKRVHDLVIAQYRALRDWHDANDAKLKGASTNQVQEIKSSLKALHDRFIAGLSAELTPGQVEKVKDKMTYSKVQVTYNGYCEMLPSLTEPQKAKILDWLKEAREEAMDGGSAEEKSYIFNKYKGRINNYLSREGYDLKQASQEWAGRQKEIQSQGKTSPVK